MKKISSGMRIFTSKKLIPALFFMCIVPPAIMAAIDGQWMFVALAFVMGFFLLILAKQRSEGVDEVYDCGDYLLVRRNGDEEVVPFLNIVTVTEVPSKHSSFAVVDLTEPGRFGSRFFFSPKSSFTFSEFFAVANNAIVNDLKARVDIAKLKRASAVPKAFKDASV